ncbi:MAG: hypothetical protein K8S94_05850 [Planctomycetia bacterium]|nr:hypothetical protein [Planctomycetia bacterium]
MGGLHVDPNRLGIVAAVLLTAWRGVWMTLVAAAVLGSIGGATAAALWNCLGVVCMRGKTGASARV